MMRIQALLLLTLVIPTAAQTTAKNDAELARNLAIAGIVLGALGTVALIIVLTRGRRPAAR